jgi:hypothetical protein
MITRLQIFNFVILYFWNSSVVSKATVISNFNAGTAIFTIKTKCHQI